MVSRLFTSLAANASRALKAIRAARERAWALADPDAPGMDGLLTIHLDVTLAIAQVPLARGARCAQQQLTDFQLRPRCISAEPSRVLLVVIAW